MTQWWADNQTFTTSSESTDLTSKISFYSFCHLLLTMEVILLKSSIRCHILVERDTSCSEGSVLLLIYSLYLYPIFPPERTIQCGSCFSLTPVHDVACAIANQLVLIKCVNYRIKKKAVRFKIIQIDQKGDTVIEPLNQPHKLQILMDKIPIPQAGHQPLHG